MKFYIFTIYLFALCQKIRSNPIDSPSSYLSPNSITTISDLVIECKLIILERLSFRELLSMAESSRHFSYLAGDVFRRKHANKTIQIIEPFFGSSSIQETSNVLSLGTFTTAARVLKTFGHLIRHLKIENYMTTEVEASKAIKHLINQNCAQTLTHLEISNQRGAYFTEFTIPFKHLEEMSLRGEFEHLDSSLLRFAELFPSLCRLSLVNVKILSPITENIPHLMQFDVEVSQFDDGRYFTANVLKKFIENNSQIRDLRLKYVNRKLLQFVAGHLTHLETLRIAMYYRENETNSERIFFKNLRSFTMVASSQSAPSNIEFGNLMEFQTDAHPTRCLKWMEIVEMNKYLQRLTVNERFLNDTEVNRLAEATSNLKDLTFSSKDLSISNLATIIRNNERLKRIQLTVGDFSKSGQITAMDELEQLVNETLGRIWTVSKSGLRFILKTTVF